MIDPSIVPLFKKRQFVSGMSEDDFRDQLIRPLFIRKKFQHGAELCGPTEAGKDCFFRAPAPFGPDYITVVQTKAGNLNMGREPSKNVSQAAVQMKTAMEAAVHDLRAKKRRLPNFGYLCASGVISEQAKGHIIDSVSNPNITFLDIDDLIPEVDAHFPEFWHGISADRLPYLRSLEQKLLTESEFASLAALIRSTDSHSPVSDHGFVELRLCRSFLAPKNRGGRITQEPDFEEVAIDSLIKKPATRFLILGEAGSGKSTLLKRAAELMCRDGIHGRPTPIPVLLKAIDISCSTSALGEDALRASASHTASGETAFSTIELQEGNVCLLVDALDEIGSTDSLLSFASKLKAFDAEFPKCRVIITSRNYSYIRRYSELNAYTRYNVAPIGLREATKIINNLGKKRLFEKEKGKEIMRQLESIHGFDLNPLVVTVFAASADSSRKDIPCNITELFAKFTELMLGRWDSEKGLSQQHEAQLKSLLLEKVAFKMHVGRKVRIRSDEFRALIAQELEELGKKETKIDTLLDEIIVRSSLVREVDGFTEFRHLLIQEFFAGKAIRDDGVLPQFVTDEWWRRPLVFYFGTNPSNDAALKRLCRPEIAPTSNELFNLSVTLGLATQACYFVKLKERTELMEWVIHGLAASSVDLLKDDGTAKFPLHGFIFSYLTGRDSVGADCTLQIHRKASKLALSNAEINELEEFWLIVGLMESGHTAQALDRLKEMKPKHALPMLAVHLGAFLIEHVRGVSKEKKEAAKSIREYVQPKVAPLVQRYLKEFKTQLLEIQRGQVKELTPEGEAGLT